MKFAVRTAAADRVIQLAALHARHAEVEGYVPAEDDSHLPRYSDHFFVTNQEAWEQTELTQRFAAPTQAAADEICKILNHAIEHGYWREVNEDGSPFSRFPVAKPPGVRAKNWKAPVPKKVLTLYPKDQHAPPEVLAEVRAVLGKAWHKHAHPNEKPPSAIIIASTLLAFLLVWFVEGTQQRPGHGPPQTRSEQFQTQADCLKRADALIKSKQAFAIQQGSCK